MIASRTCATVTARFAPAATAIWFCPVCLVDGDQRRAGALADQRLDVGHVDARLAQRVERDVRELVVADAPHQVHAPAEPRGGDRLVHALAAGAELEPVARSVSPGPHEARHAHRDVDVQAPDDRDVAHRAFR